MSSDTACLNLEIHVGRSRSAMINEVSSANYLIMMRVM
jgi:hypothetical protein